MKRRLLASKRDVTGLACLVGMGLLVLLAWANLPGSSAESDLPEARADRVDVIELHTPPAAPGALDLPDNGPDPAPHGKDTAKPRASIDGSSRT